MFICWFADIIFICWFLFQNQQVYIIYIDVIACNLILRPGQNSSSWEEALWDFTKPVNFGLQEKKPTEQVLRQLEKSTSTILPFYRFRFHLGSQILTVTNVNHIIHSLRGQSQECLFGFGLLTNNGLFHFIIDIETNGTQIKFNRLKIN